MRVNELGNACDVVSDDAGTFYTMVNVVATARPFPGLKSNSDKHRLTLPTLLNSIFPVCPLYPLSILGHACV